MTVSRYTREEFKEHEIKWCGATEIRAEQNARTAERAGIVWREPKPPDSSPADKILIARVNVHDGEILQLKKDVTSLLRRTSDLCKRVSVLEVAEREDV